MENKLENFNSKKNIRIIFSLIVLVLVFFIGRWSVKNNPTPLQNFQAGGMQNRMRGGNFGGMLTGVVDSISNQELVIKGQDGSSKIILLTGSTTISKSNTASSSDLINGVNVMVRGKANSDGSVVADSVQIFTDQNFGFRGKN